MLASIFATRFQTCRFWRGYVPLPDGRRIPVAMQDSGAGDGGLVINTTSNLDLRGSSLSEADVQARVNIGMARMKSEILDDILRSPTLARKFRGR